MRKLALAYNSSEPDISFGLKIALSAITLNATIHNYPKLSQQNWRCKLKC